MTFAELKAQQDAQAQAMPEQDTVQTPAPAPDGAVSFAQIAAQQSMPGVTAQQQQQHFAPALAADATINSMYAINPYLDPNIDMPEPEPFDVTNLKYANDAPADPLADTTHISGRRDDVYDRVYL